MDSKLGELPRDVKELQELVRRLVAESEQKLLDLSRNLEKEHEERVGYQNQALKYFEEIQQLRRQAFGRKAERLSPEDQSQLRLFNEAEETVWAANTARPEEPAVAVKAHSRRPRGRKLLPPEIPRIEQIHDIPDAEKRCGCGASLTRIGQESVEKLEVIPARIRVRRHVRPKYACKVCEGSGDEAHPAVRIAPAVKQLLPRSIASPALIAYVMTGKFCDALPFYRQEMQFQRIGVDISRQDMANWSMKLFGRLAPLLSLLRGQILAGPLVGIDETTMQVLQEPGRSNTTKSYMWVFLGGLAGRPAVEFHYHPTRSGKVPLEILQGYQGRIQTDGYEGYEELGRQPGIEHVGCWAHARRKFFEAKEVSKQTGSCEEALARIDGLFRVERVLRDQNLDEQTFLERRRTEVQPILTKLRQWLEKRQPQVPPTLLLGKAIHYTLSQWQKLVRYVDSAVTGPDNNGCERAIRPFVVGRKNWLLSGSPAGAEASSGWYSLIETAKLNGVEPYLYLRYILSRLPESTNPQDYEGLLPWNVPKGSLLDFESGDLH